METNPTYHDGSDKSLQLRLTALEKAFADVSRQAQKYTQDRDLLIDQNHELKQENHRLQQDYETLRLQKGGFGFKMLLFSGIGGFVSALILCYIYVSFIKAKPQHVLVFQQFSHENQFKIEYALSHAQYEEVESLLYTVKAHPEYQPIRPEIEFTQKLVAAAKRGYNK
jgi:hypothetical protein